MKTLGQPQIRLLATVFCRGLRGSNTSSEALAVELKVEARYVEDLCRTLGEEGLLASRVGGGWALTELGRSNLVVVFTGGVFDIIHPGHLFTLSSAKELGDVLVVSVARDKTVRLMKGHETLNDEVKRVELVASLRPVDMALLGSETDIFETVMRVKPDIIALGYDQKHSEEEIAAEAERRGLKLRAVRLSSPIPHVKSSDIIRNGQVIGEF